MGFVGILLLAGTAMLYVSQDWTHPSSLLETNLSPHVDLAAKVRILFLRQKVTTQDNISGFDY